MARSSTAFQWISDDLRTSISEALAGLEPVVKVEEPKIEDFLDIDFNAKFKDELKIVPKKGGLVAFTVNAFQRCLNTLVRMYRVARIPVRFQILKTRQRGGSAWAQGVIFVLCKELAFRTAITITHQKKAARKMFGRQRIFYNKLPAEEKEKKPLESGKPGLFQLEYDDKHGSLLQIDTAGGEETERSATNQYIHGSEVAYWPNQKQNMTNLMKTVPDKNVTFDTFVVWESTANGMDEFEKNWQLAVRGLSEPGISDWIPIFIGLKTDEEAWDEIVPDGKCTEIAQGRGCDPYEIAAEWGFIPDKEEVEFAEKWEVWPELLKWCRRKRNDECSGDWNLFCQEYPVSPEVAFLFTGMSWFSQQIIKDKIKLTTMHGPIYQGDVDWATVDSPKVELMEDTLMRGPLKIWEYPDADFEYSIGMDVAEGVNADFTEIVVMRNQPPRIVAHYRNNNITPLMAGVKVYQLGSYYNMAFTIVERNGPGFGVLSILQRPPVPSDYALAPGNSPYFKPIQGQPYPNLYYQVKGIEGNKNPEEMDRAGWPTNRDSKEMILRNLKELVLHEDHDNYSIELLYQMEGFKFIPPQDGKAHKWLETNRDPVTGLRNDDGVISCALANQARLISQSHRITSGMKARRASY